MGIKGEGDKASMLGLSQNNYSNVFKYSFIRSSDRFRLFK